MSKRIQRNPADGDSVSEILSGFQPDGTHPDFPVRRFLNLADWTRLPWSELAFELPALVVYGLDETGEPPAVGVVFAISHTVEGTEILVMSKRGGETLCHRADLSPGGKRPSYLLVKKHLTLADAP
jgi:hypothetical protein